jgi:hypothetical protein
MKRNTLSFVRPASHRNGSILLIVMVTVAILALSVLSFSSLMLVEEKAARVMTRQVQSKHLADSGVEYARVYLARPEAEIEEGGGLWNNEGSFRGVPAVTDINNPERNADIGRFTLVAPNLNEEGVPEGRRYGLVDESSKININVLPYYDFYERIRDPDNEPVIARDILLSLPDMEEDIADAILDFVDAGSEKREYGAESEYYNGLNPPYNAKDGPLDSIDELLLVRGVTPELLFGLDTNRNGVLDDTEATLGNVSSTEAESNLGWANYLTLYGKERNLTPEGLPRININADDLDQLYDDLKSTFDDDWANFILMYRLGYSPGEPQNETDVIGGASLVPFEIPEDAESKAEFKFSTVLDFMDITFATNEVDDDGNPIFASSPLSSFPPNNPAILIALQSLTVYDGISVPGRINVRQAPRAALAGLEIELEPGLLDEYRKYETWLLADGHVDLATMKELMPYINSGGDVFRAEIVGYFGDGRGTSRAEAVFDTTLPLPKLLMWRSKSHLQTGYSIEALGSELQAIGSQLER